MVDYRMLRPSFFARLRGIGGELRRLVSRRWFQVFLRDALLFLALAVGVSGLDSSQVIWSLWWPLPLAWTAALLTLHLNETSFLRWRHLGWIVLLFLPLASRMILSLGGLLPAEGLRETQELAVIFFGGVSLWLAGSSQPVKVIWLWTGALLFGWLTTGCCPPHLSVGRNSWDHSASVTMALAALWGVAAGLWGLEYSHRSYRSHRSHKTHKSPGEAAPRSRAADLWNLAFLGGGLWLGWACYVQQLRGAAARGPLPSVLALEAGLHAQRILWLKSLLFGWGHGTLDRLIQVLAEPRPAAVTSWGGPLGILALGGAVGAVLLMLLALAMYWQCRRAPADRAARPFILPASLAAFGLLGLLVGGGPRSGLVPFALAGWVALALARPAARPRPGPGPGPLPALTGSLAALVLLALLALPTWGRAILAKTAQDPSDPEGYRQKLYRAQWLDPFEPGIPLALAGSFRKSMTGENSRSQVLYLRVARLYHEAAELDPYDTIIPLRLANFQLQCDRQEEAIETVREALGRRPNSFELLDWTFLVALRLNLHSLACQVLEQGLKITPMKSLWWQRQSLLARRLGQGPLADQSLAVALTAEPDNRTLAQSAWEANKSTSIVPSVPAAAQPSTADSPS